MAKVIGIGLQLYGQATGNAYLTLAGTAILSGDAAVQAKRAKRRATAEFNAGLEDRLEMVDIQPDAPRTLALGRVRTVEGIRRKWVSGTNSQRLTMVVSFAGHEIDGFEQFYFGDVPVTLDGSGYVLTAPFNKGNMETRTAGAVLSGAGTATITFAGEPIAGSLSARWRATGGGGGGSGDLATSVDTDLGTTTVFVSGGEPGAQATVYYQIGSSSPTARIRSWTGAPGQNVGAAIAAEYPGKITANDRFAGMAVAVVDIDYDPDVYPQGRPNVTAVLRGAKVLDPRTDTTAWSENPAVHAYHYARHVNGWNVPAGEIRTADVIAAADVCDVSTVFTLRNTAGVASTVTLPRYRCGIVISTAGDPREAMDEILQTMAGRSGWAGGTWRLKAGHMPAPVFSINEQWLARTAQADGSVDPGPVIQFSNGVPREQKVNRVTGKCVNPAERYQVLPFPAVQDAVLIAAEGATYPLEVELQGVNHIAHAQHLGKVTIRQLQAALLAQVSCNLRAYTVELFDVGELTLARYGMTEKTMEVRGWAWQPTQGVTLQLAEITEAIYEPVDELTGVDPAPNSDLPSPWQVEQVTGLAVESGTVPLTDGSVLTRTQISWDAAVGQSIRAGGKVQVQYIEAADTLPDEWAIWDEAGSAESAIIPGLKSDARYLFRARFISAPPLSVRGMWSTQIAHTIAIPPGGAGGAPVVTLTSTGQIFVTPSGGGAPAPASVTLTATAANIPSPNYDWFIDGVLQTAPVPANELVVPSFAAGSPSKSVRVHVSGSGGVSAFDVLSVYSVQDGSDAYAAGLENQNQTVTCNSAGTPDAGQLPLASKMLVVKGAAFLTSGVVFSVVAGSVVGLSGVSINATTGVIAITGITADFGEATFRAAVTGGPTFDLVFNANKSRDGADGVDAGYITVTSNAGAVFLANATGTGFTPSSIVLSRNRTDVSDPGAVGTVWTVVQGTFTGSLTVVNGTTGAIASFGASALTTDSVTFRCTVVDSITSRQYSDEITIFKSRDPVSGYLTNDSIALPAAADGGAVSSYTGASGTFKVLGPAGEIATSALSFSVPATTGFTSTSGLVTISSAGNYSVTGGINVSTGTTVATVTFRAVYTDPLGGTKTIDRIFTLTKARAGSIGADGDPGVPGTRGSLDLYISGSGPLTTAEANAAVLAQTGSSLRVVGDTVTEYNGSNYVDVLRWDGANWVPPGLVIDGDALVTGTVTAAKLAANTITAASGVIADLAVGTLKLAGNAVTIPVGATTSTDTLVTATTFATAQTVHSLGYSAATGTTPSANQLVTAAIALENTGTADGGVGRLVLERVLSGIPATLVELPFTYFGNQHQVITAPVMDTFTISAGAAYTYRIRVYKASGTGQLLIGGATLAVLGTKK